MIQRLDIDGRTYFSVDGQWCLYEDHVKDIAELEAENKRLKDLLFKRVGWVTQVTKEDFDVWLNKALEE